MNKNKITELKLFTLTQRYIPIASIPNDSNSIVILKIWKIILKNFNLFIFFII